MAKAQMCIEKGEEEEYRLGVHILYYRLAI